MTNQLSEERNVGLDTVAATFVDDVIGVELTPGLVRIALGEIRSDHRGRTIVRNSVPVALLVLPNDVAMDLLQILSQAIQEAATVAQPGTRMAFYPPRPEGH